VTAAASVSAGTAVLRHGDLSDLNRTAVESKSNRSCNHRIKRSHYKFFKVMMMVMVMVVVVHGGRCQVSG